MVRKKGQNQKLTQSLATQLVLKVQSSRMKIYALMVNTKESLLPKGILSDLRKRSSQRVVQAANILLGGSLRRDEEAR